MYIIQELQTSNGTTALTPAVIAMDRKAADSTILLACSYAVKSRVTVDAVT